MINKPTCPIFHDSDNPSFLVEYRGNFLEEMSKIDYACGYTINSTLASISVRYSDIQRLKQDIPSIVFIEDRGMFVLENSSPTSTSGISPILQNPYLNLDGREVLIGMIDTGIDYLNKEFQMEDGKTRILSIWDQTIEKPIYDFENNFVALGEIYSYDQINSAIDLKNFGGDPYSIVPSIDTFGHGTKMAGIIGGTGYSKEFQGIATKSNFVIVKVLTSANYKNILEKEGIFDVPVYNVSEIVSAMEYLKNYAKKANRPMVIYLGMGATEYSHDGTTLLSRYIDKISGILGVTVITGTGNEGNAECHTSGEVKNVGDISTSELLISKSIRYFNIKIWIKRPNKMSLNIISPSGEQSNYILSEVNEFTNIKFIYENTNCSINFSSPDDVTGNEVISIRFDNIKPGIWQFQLKGQYIINGQYDIWLPPNKCLPIGTKFLSPNPLTTLTLPSTSGRVISCGFYNSENDSMVSESGKGYTLNEIVKPDIVAPGINITTTKVGGELTTVSGSSVAAAITAGVCALLIQWGIIEKNDTSLYSVKIRSYLIAGAKRITNFNYPNADWGYGILDLNGVFNVISGKRGCRSYYYTEYYLNNMFFRIPQELGVIKHEKN